MQIGENSAPEQNLKVTKAEPSKSGTEQILVNTNVNVHLPDNNVDASRYLCGWHGIALKVGHRRCWLIPFLFWNIARYLKRFIADLEDDNDGSPHNEEEIVLHLSAALRGFYERRSVLLVEHLSTCINEEPSST